MYENGGKKRIKVDLPSFEFNGSKIKFILKILYRLAIICIFFFALIFIYNKINDSKTKQYGMTEFNSNLTYIDKTMTKYYKSNHNLKNTGDSTSLSLEEMVSNNIIKANKIDGYEKCDIKNSYTKLTKIKENEYIITTTLICNKVEENYENTLYF